MEIEFTNLLVVVAVGFTAPLLLGLAPGLRFPAVVLEIVAGIIVGPAVLGWVEIDEPVRVLSILGLATLLFLAGLEIDYDRLRGRVARLAGGGFVLSFAIAVAVGLLLRATDTVNDALFIAIVLSATSLGVVIPVLKDSGNIETPFGQLVIAAASIADFVTIILLTLFFSEEASSTTATLLLLGAFIVLSVLLGLRLWYRYRNVPRRRSESSKKTMQGTEKTMSKQSSVSGNIPDRGNPSFISGGTRRSPTLSRES